MSNTTRRRNRVPSGAVLKQIVEEFCPTCTWTAIHLKDKPLVETCPRCGGELRIFNGGFLNFQPGKQEANNAAR